MNIELFPERSDLSPAPTEDISSEAPLKRTGAYRPPGARGQPAAPNFMVESPFSFGL